MATPVHCITCGTELAPHHCGHTGCWWRKCTNRQCMATLYDLERGIRLYGDKLEKLSSPAPGDS